MKGETSWSECIALRWPLLAGLFVTAMVVVGGIRLVQAEPPITPDKPANSKSTVERTRGTSLSKAKGVIRPSATPFVPQGVPPNRIQPFDVLQIRVIGTILDQPIDGYFLVELDGRVALGPAYGRVNVKDLTPVEAQEKIRHHLKKILAQPEVQVTMERQRTLRAYDPTTVSH